MFELGIQKNWIDALCARSSVRQYTGAPDKEQLDRLGETCRKLSWQGVKIRMFKGPGLKSQIKGTDVYAVIVAKRGTPMEVEGYMGEALVLEANHDVDMVRRGPYPQRLKQRILGRRGHLNNEDCARALCELAESGTRAVFLSHLSTDNNLPELAYNTVCGALSAAGFDVGNDIHVCVSRRDRVSDLLTLQTDEADAM